MAISGISSINTTRACVTGDKVKARPVNFTGIGSSAKKVVNKQTLGTAIKAVGEFFKKVGKFIADKAIGLKNWAVSVYKNVIKKK